MINWTKTRPFLYFADNNTYGKVLEDNQCKGAAFPLVVRVCGVGKLSNYSPGLPRRASGEKQVCPEEILLLFS